MEFSKNIKYQIYIYYKVANIFSIARKLLTSDQFLTTLPILTTGGRISRTCPTTILPEYLFDDGVSIVLQ